MSRIITALFVCVFAIPPTVLEAEPDGNASRVSLHVTASHQLAQMIEAEKTHPPIWRSQTAGGYQRSGLALWTRRHPVLFGALAGATVGTLAVVITPDECRVSACYAPEASADNVVVFAGVGAAVGALIGWAVSTN